MKSAWIGVAAVVIIAAIIGIWWYAQTAPRTTQADTSAVSGSVTASY